MLDPNVIAQLETHLREARNKQSRLGARLRELENESDLISEEIAEIDNYCEQMTSTIDSLLAMMSSGGRSLKASKKTSAEDDFARIPEVRNAKPKTQSGGNGTGGNYRPLGSVSYLNQNRGIPTRSPIEPISHRFADRTITQACTLLLRESGVPLHVNELYNLLVAGGMEFKGNNPTISVAVSLNRNRRFRKVGPGTFDLIMREASQSQAAS